VQHDTAAAFAVCRSPAFRLREKSALTAALARKLRELGTKSTCLSLKFGEVGSAVGSFPRLDRPAHRLRHSKR
jgi:hypothetical protein